VKEVLTSNEFRSGIAPDSNRLPGRLADWSAGEFVHPVAPPSLLSRVEGEVGLRTLFARYPNLRRSAAAPASCAASNGYRPASATDPAGRVRGAEAPLSGLWRCP